MGFARYRVAADTDAEALTLAERAMFDWKCFFGMFGCNAVIGRAGEQPDESPNDVPAYIERGLPFYGSPDIVCRQFGRAFGCDWVEYLWLFTANALVP